MYFFSEVPCQKELLVFIFHKSFKNELFFVFQGIYFAQGAKGKFNTASLLWDHIMDVCRNS